MKNYMKINRDKILQYFENGCKPNSDPLQFGLELEHFIVKKESIESISYYGEHGIEALLKKMVPLYSDTIESEGHIIGLTRSDISISLEPAAQLEISISPQSDINRINQIYDNFYSEIEPILDLWGYRIITYGYRPKENADTLDLIPKKRYEFMDRYFQKIGPYGRQMMRGSASTQVSIDYYSETDFTTKYRLATILMPVLGKICFNTPYYEGGDTQGEIPRFCIWNYTDERRVDIQPFYKNGKLTFNDYIDFVMQAPVIVDLTNDIETYSERTIGEICNERELSEKEMEHVLSMVFPMIRLKNYLEIRYADSMPIESAVCYLILIKGLFTNTKETLENLEMIHEQNIILGLLPVILKHISEDEKQILLSFEEKIKDGTILKRN